MNACSKCRAQVVVTWLTMNDDGEPVEVCWHCLTTPTHTSVDDGDDQARW